MPGPRREDFRSGDRNEQAGIDLLRELSCFVAPFPREEDYGIDAVCTHFERRGKDLWPRRSFFVQLRSPSRRVEKLASEWIDWAFALNLPLFYVSSDRKTQTLWLYSFDLAALHCAPYRMRGWNGTLHLHLRDAPSAPTKSPPMSPAESLALLREPLDVYMGPPILRFGHADLQDAEQKAHLNDVLKKWLDLLQPAVWHRQFDRFEQARWTPNEPPDDKGPVNIIEHINSLTPYTARRLEATLPALLTVAGHIANRGTAAEQDAVATLQEFMRRSGVRHRWG